MRIAMVGVKGLPHPGGIERVVEQLGSRLVKRGHEVTVYVRPHFTPTTQTEYLGMRLLHLPSIATKQLDAMTHTLLATAHLMASGADVVHIHSIGLSPFALPLRLRRLNTVVHSHGLDWQRNKWGPVARGYLRASDYSTVYFPDVTTVVSRKMQSYYKATFGREVRYIPNGVNPAVRRAPSNILKFGLRGDDYILFASRLVPEKGLHYLLDAYRQIHNPRKKLVIAGDSNYNDSYSARLRARATDDVIFLGFATGTLYEELLSSAYVYVLPSEIEGLSTGLLEAMSFGNCVLVSNIEENLEAIGDSGVSFNSGDVGDLTSKLEALLRERDVVDSYRRRAAAYVRQNYDWDHVADEYESLYSGLVGHPMQDAATV